MILNFRFKTRAALLLTWLKYIPHKLIILLCSTRLKGNPQGVMRATTEGWCASRPAARGSTGSAPTAPLSQRPMEGLKDIKQ
jgi:hypothetical protein